MQAPELIGEAIRSPSDATHQSTGSDALARNRTTALTVQQEESGEDLGIDVEPLQHIEAAPVETEGNKV